jgi:hypothetical protein
MTLQYGTLVRNAKLDAVENTIGVTPIIELRTGAQPANCQTADAGTLLCQAALPSDWMNNAAAGSKTKLGTWQFSGLAGIPGSVIGHFRIYDAQSPSTCHIQGTVTATGGGGDMTVDNVNIAAAQVVTVNTFTLNDNNA